MSMQVTQEKLRAEIHARVNTCNLLLDQVPRAPSWGGSTRGGLGTWRHPVSPLLSLPQAIRQLENSIEKMLLKVQAAQKVTALYVEVRDALRKELDQLPMHLDLLCGTAERYHRQLEDAELVAADARRDAAVTKVRWPGAPWGPFPRSRAHRRHHAPRLGSLPATVTELRLPTAPSCLPSSSWVPLFGQSALGLGTACPKRQPR
uniref:Uncharacterized protein n=1 Tax=Athene cunicularia TaxID=194338 RepID=A0A663N6L0_ATHCN